MPQNENPDGCQRYNELPLVVRRWLESTTQDNVEILQTFVRRPRRVQDWLLTLDERDVETMDRLLKVYRDAGTISRFLRWTIVTALMVFMAMAGALEKFLSVLKWLVGKQ